jgi:hypothetical protein
LSQADPEADHTAAGIEFMESGAVQLGLDSFRVAAHLTPGATTWSNLCTALREEENPNRWQCTAEARTACQRALRFDHRHDAALEILSEIPEHISLSDWFNSGWADVDDFWHSAQEQFEQGRPVVVRNALRDDLARQLHAQMDTATDWTLREGSGFLYQYRGSSITSRDRGYSNLTVLHEMFRFLESDVVRDRLAASRGFDMNGS